MIIRTFADIQNTDRNVDWGNGRSYRFLLESDNMGFTLTETTVNAGTESLIQYDNYVEACYCIEGEGEIECESKIYPIKPGTMYAPNAHDKHYLRASQDQALRLVCVFSPALKGIETHHFNEDASEASGY
ncbi:MAG: ectoine synthase [Thiotrichaceae bacterium]|nr:ectoine synthase [Thiotrichaceae bacterium]